MAFSRRRAKARPAAGQHAGPDAPDRVATWSQAPRMTAINRAGERRWRACPFIVTISTWPRAPRGRGVVAPRRRGRMGAESELIAGDILLTLARLVGCPEQNTF